jgi:hypothetical protein
MNRRARHLKTRESQRKNRRRQRRNAASTAASSESSSASGSDVDSPYRAEYSPYRPEQKPPAVLFVTATRLEPDERGRARETAGRLQKFDQTLPPDEVAEIATANANMALADSGLRLGVSYSVVREHAVNDRSLATGQPHSTFMNVHTSAGAGSDKIRAVAGLHVCQGPTGPSPYGYFYAAIVLSYARPAADSASPRVVARREVATVRLAPGLGRRVRGDGGIRFVAGQLRRLAARFGAESSCDCTKQISLRAAEGAPCPACDADASPEELAAQADVALAVAKYAIVSDYSDWDDRCVQGIWSNSGDLSGAAAGDEATGVSAVVAFYLYRPGALPE